MAGRISQFLRHAVVALAVSGFACANPGNAQTPPPKKDDAGFQTSAPYAILIDADSGTVLFEKNADKLNPPASMSKLMTTEVVLRAIAEGKLKYEDEMTISENAWRKGGAPSGGSAMFAAMETEPPAIAPVYAQPLPGCLIRVTTGPLSDGCRTATWA